MNEEKIDIMLVAQIKYSMKLWKEKEELQQKINKAIDYINTSIKPLDTKILNNNEIDTLLEILEKWKYIN